MNAATEIAPPRHARRTAPTAPPSTRPEQRRPQPGAPDPERLARAVAHAYLEVEAGRRPLSQLERVLTPALWQRLCKLAIRPGPGPTANAVVAVRGQRLHDDAFDAAVVVRRGERRGVLAIRLERRHTVWRVVELARPEDVRA